MKVGTTAEPTTTVTSTVYWVWSMMPVVRPYNAEILPNVRPVLINSVDLRSGQKGEKSRAEGGKEIDPGRGMEPEEVTPDDPDEHLDQRHRDATPDGDNARDECQPHPSRRNKPHVLMRCSRSSSVSHPGSKRDQGPDRLPGHNQEPSASLQFG